MAAYSGCGEGDGGIGHGKRRSRTGVARVGGAFSWPDGGSVANGRRQVGSGMARNRARARLNFSCHGQLLGRWRVSRRAERVIRPARAKTLRRRVLVVTIRSPRPIRAVQRARLCAITCTASQAALAAKRPEGRWFSPTPYLRSRMAYFLDLGVAAVVSLQFQGLPVPVGDEAVIAVGGEESQLGTGRGLHPPDDEPHRRGVEGGVGGLGHIGAAVHPVGNRRPGIFRYRLDEIVQALALADGDGEADIHPAADGYHGVGIEAAVGPHRELSPGPGVAHRPTVSRRKWAAPRAVLARPSRSRDISTSPVPAATASSG